MSTHNAQDPGVHRVIQDPGAGHEILDPHLLARHHSSVCCGPVVLMGYSDVIDLLMEQHDEIRRLCAGVERSQGAQRERQFAELAELVHLHERGARAVVHPAVRNGTGNAVGLARLLEGAAIERSLTTLHDLGSCHPGFESGFAALYQAILEHATREELDEFPILRVQVPVQRLHMMAGELHDVQVMDAA